MKHRVDCIKSGYKHLQWACDDAYILHRGGLVAHNRETRTRTAAAEHSGPNGCTVSSGYYSEARLTSWSLAGTVALVRYCPVQEEQPFCIQPFVHKLIVCLVPN